MSRYNEIKFGKKSSHILVQEMKVQLCIWTNIIVTAVSTGKKMLLILSSVIVNRGPCANHYENMRDKIVNS